MIDSNKPDLEESVNVTEAHERVVIGAAAARESRVAENGTESISLWVAVLCAVPLLSAGWALGKAGTLFSYNDIVKDGYVRVIPSSGEDEALPPKDAVAAYSAKGAKIYAKCVGCHGADGKGDGANYPSLAGSEWVLGETERFAMVVLNGLTGPTSNGKAYGVMPAQAAGMSGDALATLMTYVRNSFGNNAGDVVTREMGAAALDISSKRSNPGSPATASELDSEHMKNLPGEPLDPTTMLDPITLEPAAAE